ncbi:MAG TPA: hypothetical protein VFD15_00505 [Clostridia bacterium]|nr:hypothetical protein [Clostridia bacterium]
MGVVAATRTVAARRGGPGNWLSREVGASEVGRVRGIQGPDGANRQHKTMPIVSA